MKKIVVILFVILFSTCQTTKMEESKSNIFYVGTYTNGESEGIYKYRMDDKGMLSKIGLVAKTNNPSFLAKTKDSKTLLAVEETDENGTGFVKSFQIQKDTLLFVSKSKSGGAHPCFITVNDNNDVLVANYTGGNVGFLKVDNQNGLTNLLALQQHTGKGTTSRQEEPHAHSTWFHPNNKEIISVDLGTNELWLSQVKETQNEYSFTGPTTLKMKEGAGPRHLTFHPNNKFIYVLNELDNTISLVKQKEGNYTIESTISMLPKGYTDYTKGADIHITNDGKFLYASNRGHNSIVIYSVAEETGKLSLVGFESVRGSNPRNFSLSSDNKFLLVANQDTNNIISFKRNTTSGKLTFVNEISAPNPVCILF
jgi:6-phosphogluconolactonase